VVQLRDLEAYGEPGAIVYRVDCVELMGLMPAGSVDAIFADPPYRLSGGGGLSVKSGRLVPVEKGEWDRSKGGFRTHYALA
jgi:site-specific DNA-methyltransferase (adenine-specific)